MYFEEAEVKEYKSVNKKNGNIRVKHQINIPINSKFAEPKTVALVDVVELNEFINSNDVAKFNELEDKFNNTSEELVQIKQQLQEEKATVERLTSEVTSLTEEKSKLENDVEEYKGASESLASDVHKLNKEKSKLQEDKASLQEKILNVEDKNEDIIQLQKEHKKEISDKDSEIAELNSKLNNEKDYSKALLIALLDSYKRNWLDRIRNIEPESTTKVLTLRPIEIEAEVHEEQED